MWPLGLLPKQNSEPGFGPKHLGSLGWPKPIEQIEVGDVVVSLDDQGNLVPGRVP